MYNQKMTATLFSCALLSFIATSPVFAQSTITQEMGPQEHGLTRWMNGVETIGIHTTVSGHPAEFIKPEHLTDLLKPKLKGLGLETIDSKIAKRENRPFFSVKVSAMPCSGNVEWEVQMRLYDRALRTDKRAAAEVIVWEYVVSNVAPGKLEEAPIDAALTAGLGQFGEAISRKPSNQPYK